MPPSAPRIRAVFFDLGGTLLDFRDPARWSRVAAEVGWSIEPEHLAHAVAEAERRFDGPAREPTVESTVGFWETALGLATGGPVAPDAVARFIERWVRDRPEGRLYSDVPRCLEELRREGRRLGVISNSQSEASVRAHLAASGILSSFDAVVSSGTEGVAKPDRAIFDRAAHRLGVSNGSAFHVGDLCYTDAKAAALAGFHSVWLNRNGTGFGEDPPEITSLSELPGFVREIEARSR